MKIAIPTDDFQTIPKKMLGRAKYFAIYQTDPNGNSQLIEKRNNPYELTLQRGKTFDVMNVLADCQVVISRHIGKKGIDRMRKAGFSVILTKQSTIENALKTYLSEQFSKKSQNDGTG